MLNSHTKNMSKTQKGVLFNTLFGTTGQASASILANNAEELEKLNKKVQESYKGQGYVQELAQKNQGTVKKQMAQFKEASEAAKMELGTALLKKLDKIENIVNENAKKLIKSVEKTPKLY